MKHAARSSRKKSEDWSDAGAVGGVLSEMWRLETLEVGATYQMLSQIARIETIFTFSGYA